MKKILALLLVVVFVIAIDRTAFGLCSTRGQGKDNYWIKVSISQCRLWLYQKDLDLNNFVLLKEYPVGTVKKTISKYPLGIGYVTAIEFSPAWYPTAYSRSQFAKKNIFLPKIVPANHSLNCMGSVKICLSHSVPGKGKVYRIHGTRPQDRKTVGTRASGGCIRMLNEDALELAKLISTGTIVEIVP